MKKQIDNDTNRFRRLLARGNVCLGDGAMGTRLHEMTGRSMACPEALVLEADGRDILGKVHAEYIAAGAQWIETHHPANDCGRKRRTGCHRRNWRGKATDRSA